MKRRKIRAKLHNAFLWVMTYSAFTVFLFSLASMDSDSWLPPVALILSVMWLSLVALANKDRWEL